MDEVNLVMFSGEDLTSGDGYDDGDDDVIALLATSLEATSSSHLHAYWVSFWAPLLETTLLSWATIWLQTQSTLTRSSKPIPHAQITVYQNPGLLPSFWRVWLQPQLHRETPGVHSYKAYRCSACASVRKVVGYLNEYIRVSKAQCDCHRRYFAHSVFGCARIDTFALRCQKIWSPSTMRTELPAFRD